MTSPDPHTPQLRRSTAERRLAGVAGGLAEFFGLNPMLVRGAFIVLSFFGVGLVAYVVLTLVMPGDPLPSAAKFAVAALALLALATVPYAGVSVLFLVVPAAVGVLVWRLLGGKVDPRLVRAATVVVVVAGAVIAGVGAGVATAFGAGTVVAACVIAAGAALLIAGLRGSGARWLIVPALLLALPASVVSAADVHLRGGVGKRAYAPATEAGLKPVYRLGAGRLRLNVRHTQFTPGSVVPLKVRVGVGQFELIVGPDVCVATTGHVGVGESRLFSEVNDGMDVDASQPLRALAGKTLIELDARVGAGQIYVDTRRDHYSREGFAPSAACATKHA